MSRSLPPVHAVHVWKILDKQLSEKKIVCQLNVRNILIWSCIINKHIFEAPLQQNRLNMLTAVILIFIWVHLQVYWLIKKVQQLFFSGAIKSMSIKSMMSPHKYDSPPLRNKQSYEIYIKLYKCSLAALKFLNTLYLSHFTFYQSIYFVFL